MKIILITKSSDLHSSRHIAKAAKDLNIDCILISPQELESTSKATFNESIIINRNSGIDYKDTDLNFLSTCKRCIFSNSLNNTRIFRDKWTQYNEFVRLNISTIPTLNLEDFSEEELTKFITRNNTEKFLIKPKRSHQTKGIIKTMNLRDEVTKMAAKADYRYIAQPFLAKASEYRVLICANKVVGVLLKKHADPYALLNCATAKLEVMDTEILPSGLVKIIDQTKAFKLNFYALDVLEDESGVIRLIELNNMPGFELFEKTTEINVAKLLLKTLIAIFKEQYT